ncbi:unnamed protein product, partial [Arabidopsis halleri]
KKKFISSIVYHLFLTLKICSSSSSTLDLKPTLTRFAISHKRKALKILGDQRKLQRSVNCITE